MQKKEKDQVLSSVESDDSALDRSEQALSEQANPTVDPDSNGGLGENAPSSEAESNAPTDQEKTDVIEETEPESPHGSAPAVEAVATVGSAAGILIKKSHAVIGVLLAIALIVGGFALGFHLSSRNDSGLRLDPNAHSYDSIQALPSGSENGISVPMFDKVIFPAGEKNVQIVLLNPKGNACYFRYTLLLKESDEMLYQSGLIQPGMAVTDITLSRAMPKGEYPLEIVEETFSMTEELTPMNGTKTEVTLYCR